jgi:ATP-dependent Clp protease ATP-binding subunit ClpC
VFERFTDDARRVVVLAQEEARGLGHPYIGTEHLLLGLMAEGQGIGARALAAVDVRLERARHEVQLIIGPGATAPAAPHIPFTRRAKKALEASLRESRAMGDESIGTEHMLLGLLDEPDGVAVQIVRSLGIDPAELRSEVLGLLGRGDP